MMCRATRDVIVMALVLPATVAFIASAMFATWVGERFGGRR